MLADKARTLLTAAVDGATHDVVRMAAQDFVDASRNASASDVRAALGLVGRVYSLPYTEHLLLVLATAGALVERGADSTPLVAPVVEFLQRLTPLAVDFHRACAREVPADADDEGAAFGQAADELRAQMPKQAEAWGMLESLYVPVIAVLATSPTARAQGRPLAKQMIELRIYNAGASWLHPMLMVLDREPILVIEPDTGLGLAGRMSGISSNFQLNALLMDIFPQSDPHGDRRISQKAADIVRGNVAQQQDDAGMVGCWNLHAWTALQGKDRLTNDHSHSATSHWIWNEGVPADIPLFDGHRVVVLGSPSYARSFSAGRDFLSLRADIEVERLLTPLEVNTWVTRFSQARPEAMRGDI
jgi:hypothetical protein